MAIRFKFNPKLFNPLYWHLEQLLKDHGIRFIMVEGGSSAAKTFTISQALLVYCMVMGKNIVVFRRFHVHIKDSVYASFKAAIDIMGLGPYFLCQNDLITCTLNGARIVFKGLDNPENIKGIETFDIVYNNEWTQFLLIHWKQQRKRLRGRPNQKFICDWNPISAKHWIYEDWIDLDTWTDLPLDVPEAPAKFTELEPEYSFKKINEVGNGINIKVTYRNNFWVVGRPDGLGGFIDIETLRDFELDRERDSTQYRIYANGERGVFKTGGEFWKQFNPDTHVKTFTYVPGPLHITFDDNSLPYVTISIWQVINTHIYQLHEIPCKAPDNNAPKAAERLIAYLDRINHQDLVYIYGDPSSKRHSTVDENSSSFYEKMEQKLRAAKVKLVNRVIKSAPEVALSAAFINEIYEGVLAINGRPLDWRIWINSTNKFSIEDYVSVKEGPTGEMLKAKVKNEETQQTYEPFGHFSDAKRYFIIELLKKEWELWKKRKFNSLAGKAGYFR